MSAETDFRLAELAHQIARAQAPTPELVSEFISAAQEGSGQVNSAATARINALIEAKAWTEAALASVKLVLPQWRLRRLIYEDGRWLCSLSRQWNLPDWLTDFAESRHASLPLAILGAVIETRHCKRRLLNKPKAPSLSVLWNRTLPTQRYAATTSPKERFIEVTGSLKQCERG